MLFTLHMYINKCSPFLFLLLLTSARPPGPCRTEKSWNDCHDMSALKEKQWWNNKPDIEIHGRQRWTVIPTLPNLDHFEALLNLGLTSNHMSTRIMCSSFLWGATVSLSCFNIQPELAILCAQRITWITLHPHRRKGCRGGRETVLNSDRTGLRAAMTSKK
jgi:hypothetical protein